MARYWFLTSRRLKDLEDEILGQVTVENWMSTEVRGDDTPQVRAQHLRLAVQQGLRNATWRPQWWARWRRTKPCIEVPCPAFEEVHLECRDV